jgi:enamine deaminase RidA (YjgF/YER057c/UK114 family)
MLGNVQHLNPAGLHKNPAYTQAVVVSGDVTTIYVGGQNAVDAAGNILGKGDIRAQTEKALKNLETALAAGGASVRILPSSPVSLFRHWLTPIFLWRLMPLLSFPRSEQSNREREPL